MMTREPVMVTTPARPGWLIGAAALLTLLASGAHAQMVGSEFRVDEGTCVAAFPPDVAINAEGISVVVWKQAQWSVDPAVPCDTPPAVMGQIYDASGLPVGGNFEVGRQDSARSLGPPQVVMNRNSFIVMWMERDSSSNDEGWFVRRFDASGQADGGKFRAVTVPSLPQFSSARLAIDDSGGFVIVWTLGHSASAGVRGRRFDAEGHPVGDEFGIIAHPASEPRIATAPGRGFIVTARTGWLAARRLDAEGVPSGDPVTVQVPYSYNTYGVAMNADGSWVMVSSEAREPPEFGRLDLVGRVFDTTGQPVGEKLLLNGSALEWFLQSDPDVATGPGGSLLVSWWKYEDASNQYPGNPRIGFRAFLPDGVPASDLIVLAEEACCDAWLTGPAAVAMDGTGRAAAAWWYHDDIQGPRILGRRFDFGTMPLTAGDVSVREASGETRANIPVVAARTGLHDTAIHWPSLRDSTVNWSTGAAGTASAGSDYQPTQGTLTIAAGQTSATLDVPILDDDVNEPSETFFVNVSSPENVVVADRQARVTIVDDERPTLRFVGGRLSPGDQVCREPAEGSEPLTFEVTLSHAIPIPATVGYATGAGGTATAGSDYAATSGTLTFAPGETAKTIAVPVLADAVSERTETFFVNLQDATNLTVADPQARGTILDVDPTPPGAPALRVADATAVEDSPGQPNVVFTVTLSAASDDTVRVRYGTRAAGTAAWGLDYEIKEGELTFDPGQTVKTVGVRLLSDALDEADETFHMELSSPLYATIADGGAAGTIVDDDAPPTVRFMGVSDGDQSIIEWTPRLEFEVGLSAPSGRTTRINYATGTGGTATSGADYEPAAGILTFVPGETSRRFTVDVINDAVHELDETFYVNLLGPTHLTVADGQAQVTIRNDNDPPPAGSPDVVGIVGGSVTEGDSGQTNLVFTIRLSHASANTVTVEYGTASVHGALDAATAGIDYQARAGLLTIEPGLTSKTFAVPVIGDDADEADEYFLGRMTRAWFAHLRCPGCVGSYDRGTIVDDDP